jgi:hypothetical protein
MPLDESIDHQRLGQYHRPIEFSRMLLVSFPGGTLSSCWLANGGFPVGPKLKTYAEASSRSHHPRFIVADAERSQRAESEQILVSVSDNGIGFPPQLAEQIFDPFFTTKPHGTGTGLRISRSIIELG